MEINLFLPISEYVITKKLLPCCTFIIPSMLKEFRLVLSIVNHPTMVEKILKFLASKRQQNFLPRLKKYNRRLYFFILLIS